MLSDELIVALGRPVGVAELQARSRLLERWVSWEEFVFFCPRFTFSIPIIPGLSILIAAVFQLSNLAVSFCAVSL